MLIEAINKVLLSKKNNEKPRDYLGASEIGHPCLRKVWYSYHLKNKKDTSAKTLMTFDVGHYLERMIIDHLNESEIKLMDGFNITSNTIPIYGHVDAFAVDKNGEVYIVEIKTACNSQFNIFKNKSLVGWKMQYYAQIQSYMGIYGIRKAILLAINKDTSDMHEEVVNFDLEYYENLKERAEYILASEDPPEKINKNPCFFICKICPFLRICHEIS